jgi:hypothetical protein
VHSGGLSASHHESGYSHFAVTTTVMMESSLAKSFDAPKTSPVIPPNARDEIASITKPTISENNANNSPTT